MEVIVELIFAGCPNLDSFLGNGLIDSLKTERPGISLAGDVRRYYCEKGFVFSEGNQTEYFYDCLPSGSWSTTESPDCVKGMFIRFSKNREQRYVLQHLIQSI